MTDVLDKAVELAIARITDRIAKATAEEQPQQAAHDKLVAYYAPRIQQAIRDAYKRGLPEVIAAAKRAYLAATVNKGVVAKWGDSWETQPRDDHGRFGEGGGSPGHTSGSSGENFNHYSDKRDTSYVNAENIKVGDKIRAPYGGTGALTQHIVTDAHDGTSLGVRHADGTESKYERGPTQKVLRFNKSLAKWGDSWQTQPRNEHGEFGEGGGSQSLSSDSSPHGGGGSGVEASALASELATPDSGFSVNITNGESPTSGYMVSQQEPTAAIPASQFSAQDIHDFIMANQDELTKPGAFLGGWHDPESGNVFLDVSQNVQSRDAAISLGVQNNQISIYDVKGGSTIPTGGTGGLDATKATGHGEGPGQLGRHDDGRTVGMVRQGRRPDEVPHRSDRDHWRVDQAIAYLKSLDIFQKAPPDRDAAEAAANAALRRHLNQEGAQEVSDHLTMLYGDAWVLGEHSSLLQIGPVGYIATNLQEFYTAIDWSDWEPGDQALADYYRGSQQNGNAPSEEDDKADADAATADIMDTEELRMTNIIADGLASGLSVDQIAANLDAAAGRNAYMTANTEVAGAMFAGAMNGYTSNNVDQWNWLAEDTACPACLDNMANGPYDVGSGPDLPEHPNCRCAPIPVITDEQGNNLVGEPESGDQHVAAVASE